MAKFVLAGKADCPFYAKAELLADYLDKNLPNFRIHKITQHPDNWEAWLQEICEKNGWKHKRSPIIWRELLDRGGKGLLLGGYNEFLEHAQHYYHISSDMRTAEMLLIANENLKTRIVIDKEEEELKSLIDPLHIWINSASAHICYQLIPLLTNGEIFGMESEVSIHLLDRSSCKDILEGIVMETQDLASPLLRSVSLHTELDEAFLEADVIVLLDDILQENIPTIEDCIRQVTHQCEIYGPLIEKNAKSSVRVVVMGKTFTNLKASLLMVHAPSVNPRNIVTVAMLLESEAKAMVARKLQMHPASVGLCAYLGEGNSAEVAPLQENVSLHTLHRHERKPRGEWMRTEFVTALSSLSSWGTHCLGLAPAHTIATLLRYWYQGSPPGEMVSLGVITEGQFGLPDGIVYSMPVRFENGTWIALTELKIDEKTDAYLQILATDLIREKQVALGEVEEMYPQRPVRKARIYMEDEEEEAENALDILDDLKYSSAQETPLETEDQFTAEGTEGSLSPEEENEEEEERFGVPADFF